MQSIHFPEIAKKIEFFFLKIEKTPKTYFSKLEKILFFFSATEKFRKLLWIKIKIENELLCHYLLHPNNEF
jgi:hypothetical protein